MYSFFDTYDFSGKTLVPFNVHNGSRFSGTIETIEELEPNATVVADVYEINPEDIAVMGFSAAGMIYSFYGRLSVGNMDTDWLAEGNLPPTFYVYGTEDPFYSQFEEQYEVIRNM